MSAIQTLNFLDFIFSDEEKLFTTSLHVAQVFRKQHRVVLKAITDLCAKLPPDRLHNFVQTVEMRKNPSGGAMIPSTSYLISRTGFTLLAMGFTGKEALNFKLAYIDAFDSMEAFVRNRQYGLRYQCARKELEMKDSEARGTLHGRGLNQRRREKPVLKAEYEALMDLIQPSLLN